MPDGFPRGRPASLISGRSNQAVDEPVICSAKGCQQAAAWALLWNNPKLHTPDRRKTWVACDDHRQSLSDFLAARNFLKDVEPLPD
jgi:hypothetical protein